MKKIAAVFAFCLIMCQTASAAIPKSMVDLVNGAVFEVLLLKPTQDSLSYEKPLPLEFLPFSERQDKYHSIGSAFLIDGGRFITAGHVMDLQSRSQFQSVYIRDTQKNVYEVDKILSYSYNRDFVVFTVKNPPSRAAFKLNATPKLNSYVYAVGNALGEGVVMREGVLTSRTDEDLKGEWKWLRFSAAASPGNSGGPLLDENGDVIGIVLRKSPNENLNFALPIGEISNVTPNRAVVSSRFIFKMPNAAKTYYDFYSFETALPKAVAGVRSEIVANFDAYYDRAMRALLKKYDDSIFPNGTGSEELLFHSQYDANFPNIIGENEFGSWMLFTPKDLKSVPIGNNGFLSFGTYQDMVISYLQRPNNVSLAELCSDSKRMMDLILKGSYFGREVGAEKIKITSLGSSVTSNIHVDRYGRKWLVRRWLIEYSDSQLVAVSLPTPHGMVSVMQLGKTGDDYMEWDLKLLTDFVTVDYFGTFFEWQAYLSDPTYLPDSLKNLSFKFDAKHVHFAKDNVRIDYDNKLLPISADGVMDLGFSFRRAKNGVAWQVVNAAFSEDRHSGNTFSYVKNARPEGDLNDEFFSNWRKLVKSQYPYNETTYTKDGQSVISGVFPHPKTKAEPDELISLAVAQEGQKTQTEMKSLYDRFRQGFKTN